MIDMDKNVYRRVSLGGTSYDDWYLTLNPASEREHLEYEEVYKNPRSGLGKFLLVFLGAGTIGTVLNFLLLLVGGVIH